MILKNILKSGKKIRKKSYKSDKTESKKIEIRASCYYSITFYKESSINLRFNFFIYNFFLIRNDIHHKTQITGGAAK
jgi:hypothetical protein